LGIRVNFEKVICAKLEILRQKALFFLGKISKQSFLKNKNVILMRKRRLK